MILRAARMTASAALAAGMAIAGPATPAGAADRYLDEVFAKTVRQSAIPYDTARGAHGERIDLHLDVHRPAGDRATKRPAIVWIHGGGFRSGWRGGPVVRTAASSFARRGYVAVSIDYRLLARRPCGGARVGPSCTVAMNAARRDAERALTWVRRHARGLGVDPTRIAVGGFSAGAITSLLVGTRAGPRAADVDAIVSNCGGLPTDDSIDAGDAPTIFFHGVADHLVPYERAASNHEALRAAGVRSSLVSYERGRHCTSWWEPDPGAVLDRTARFLRGPLHLRPSDR